jgi:hypothetical protein
VSLNFDTAAITFGIAEQSLFILNDKLVFGGQSYGFKTKFQNSTYDITNPYYDAHLFNLDLSEASNCFYTREITDQIEDATYVYGDDAPDIEVYVPPIYLSDICEAETYT